MITVGFEKQAAIRFNYQHIFQGDAHNNSVAIIIQFYETKE